MKVSFIGSGNTATQLVLMLHEKGVEISQIISASLENAKTLAQKVNAQFSNDIALFDESNTDILFIAATDDKVLEIATELVPQTKVVVVHTSGSVDVNVLVHHEKHGVFYPFISMQKNIETDFSHAPILLEANDKQTVSTLKQLANRLSDNIAEVNTQQRQMLHLAAVFANNFVNNQLTIAEDILTKNNLPFDLLRPLLASYFEKLKTRLPHELQTGPAVRNDMDVIEKHLKLLENEPEYRNIYELISANIQRGK